MACSYWIILFTSIACPYPLINASAGDAQPQFRSCVEACEKSGCVGDTCFRSCKLSSEGKRKVEGVWYQQEPLYLRWKQWDCRSDCRYHCMVDIEEKRTENGHSPMKYNGKWPFRRAYGFQEPVSVALSALNLAMQFQGWLSFFILVHYKLPVRPNSRRPYYEYTCLWHAHAVLSMNSWFWSALFHGRDVEVTEKLDYSSAVASVGYSFVVSALRVFNVRDEATRVMVSAPLIAFVTTHILYLNLYRFDYGLNMRVCVALGVVQLLMWSVWAGVTRHPSRWKLWTVVVGGALAMMLEIYDFPPYYGYVDAHALWHAATIPLTYLWWSFIADDCEFRTARLHRNAGRKKD